MNDGALEKKIDQLGKTILPGILEGKDFNDLLKPAREFLQLLFGRLDSDSPGFVESYIRTLNALRYGGFFDAEEVKDILQNTAKTVITSLRKMKNNIEKAQEHQPVRFVKAVALNEMRRAFRKKKREDQRFEKIQVPQAGYFNPVFEERIIFSELLGKTLLELPPRYRIIIILTHIKGLTPRQIVERMNLSDEAHYYKVLSRARARASNIYNTLLLEE